jgi:DNA-directed RNA polymerase alpha subunit
MRLELFVREMTAAEAAMVKRILGDSFHMFNLIEEEQFIEGKINVSSKGVAIIKPEEFLQVLQKSIEGLATKRIVAEVPENTAVLYQEVRELDVSVRTASILAQNPELPLIGHLVQLSAEDAQKKIRGINSRTLKDLIRALMEMGLSFGTPLENFPDKEILKRLKKA